MFLFVISSIGHTGTYTAVHGKNWPRLFYGTIQVVSGELRKIIQNLREKNQS